MTARREVTKQIRLLALTDHESFPDCLIEAETLCAEARAGSVGIVMRDRQTPIRTRLEWGKRLREVTRHWGQELWVADRIDLATCIAADGVHLPCDGFSPGACRRIWAGGISRAWHRWETLADRDWEALDWLLVSPVLQERKGRPPLGLGGLERACAELRAAPPWPHGRIAALGGVTGVGARGCLEAGAAAVAAIGAAWDPEERGRLLAALDIVRQEVRAT